MRTHNQTTEEKNIRKLIRKNLPLNIFTSVDIPFAYPTKRWSNQANLYGAYWLLEVSVVLPLTINRTSVDITTDRLFFLMIEQLPTR
jgi:hypothetical protein